MLQRTTNSRHRPRDQGSGQTVDGFHDRLTKLHATTRALWFDPATVAGIQIDPEIPDIVVDPGGELLLPNKIGGRPYCYYGTRSYIESMNALFDQGFFLFLQLTWGGYERTVPFLWPFDRYTFHLL